jgi:nucleoside-diphosphate-sugar epimerase
MCSTVSTYGVNFNFLPVTEDCPLKPIASYGQNKAEADAIFIEAFLKNKFPVTIIKPSTTYGSKSGLLRQVGAQDFSWIDRIRKSKPILVCGDGNAIHQFMHVDDAALAFVGILKKEHCYGQTYNLVNREYFTWNDYHKLAMKVLGKESKLIGVPFNNLEKLKVPGFDLCREVFAHHAYFSSDKLYNDLPEFKPKITLEEGMKQVIASLDSENRIANSNYQNWEDLIINKQNKVKKDWLIKINKLFFKVKKKLFYKKK